jgi:thiamine biosynthesis protein ThiI
MCLAQCGESETNTGHRAFNHDFNRFHSTGTFLVQAMTFYFNTILCRYSEIATKGRNRRQFEEMLAQNLTAQLKEMSDFKVVRERGRMYLKSKRADGFSDHDLMVLKRNIRRVFGIASVSPALETRPELSEIETAVDALFEPAYANSTRERARSNGLRYAMRARRSDKNFPMSSHDVEVYFAEKLLAKHSDLTVDLTNPELCVQVEIRKDLALVSLENYEGPGGLPSGCGGKVLTLLSGGIDSPVAAYQIMRRGSRSLFVTFHSSPYTPDATLQKVTALARRLRDFQLYGRLFAVNLLVAQKQIRDACDPRLRTVLYRRLMLRVAETIARRFGARALVTGDNLGQVASQTMENIDVINCVTDVPVFRPVLTFDKVDTMRIAREIDTYDISKVETPDSCTVFAPRRPATTSKRDQVEHQEKRLPYNDIVQDILDNYIEEVDLDNGSRCKCRMMSHSK